MSYTLGDTTLPNPINMLRRQVEIAGSNITLTGRTVKDIRNRKEQFILTFRFLTQTEVANILSEYNKEETVDFTISEPSLTVAATPVHIVLPSRRYNQGGDYLEDFNIILTEVV